MVFKFGGASVKDAKAVKNIVSILKETKENGMIVVLSAMGKMTNSLEELADHAFKGNKAYKLYLEKIFDYHYQIINELFCDDQHPIYQKVKSLNHKLEYLLDNTARQNYEFYYDQIIPFGELLSTTIVCDYLNEQGILTHFLDARDVIVTNEKHRNADVNWAISKQKILSRLKSINPNAIVLTQGFIAASASNKTTTLGREGSDFTASIFAHVTNAKKIVIWKDVPGLLNADPKIFQNTYKLDFISYQEAIELSYYGAKIIHPKTIKPLQNKNIPLYIKSFENPQSAGSLISSQNTKEEKHASIILKIKQQLITFSSRDYSFIAENHLTEIFNTIANLGIRINVMQNSAISFSICIDENPDKLKLLIEQLNEHYKICYNSDLKLLTIRHYTDELIKKHCDRAKILLEQRSRNTVQYVLQTN